MAYDEKLAARVRALLPRRGVEPKRMMGGLTFMVNGKMCVGVHTGEIMVRFDPALQDEVLSRKGARPMDFTGKVMRGFVFVGREGIRTERMLKRWVDLGLAFNKRAKASGRRRGSR